MKYRTKDYTNKMERTVPSFLLTWLSRADSTFPLQIPGHIEVEVLVTAILFHSGQSETPATQLTETFTTGMKLNLFKKI